MPAALASTLLCFEFARAPRSTREGASRVGTRCERSARRVAVAAPPPPHSSAAMSSCRADGRRARKTGPDSRYSWVVALACGGVNVFMHASGKVVGLLFFGMLDEFAVSRETAAWPLVLNNTLLNVAGG
ncbi:hypothetical protein HPB49_005029 [Dermacentor silvarum]|uniref:Uncharacterized protein n=1 Tax=Dermacentor silvarum TaxID=543639 RepID=A0ACB8D307_DERSI|nr:hypothetical protein HPB49_005029 [Dermacentor silvarum]